MENKDFIPQNTPRLDPDVLARKIVTIISDMKAENIILLDIRELTHIADYFIICTGNSDRQLKAIIEKVMETIKQEERIPVLGAEGRAEGGWMLLDYGDVVVHAFTEEQRKYYNLEGLWNQGKILLRMQ